MKKSAPRYRLSYPKGWLRMSLPADAIGFQVYHGRTLVTENLFKAERKEVAKPGSHGSLTWYRDDKGSVRYGQPPSGQHVTIERIGPEHMGRGHQIQADRLGEQLRGTVSQWGPKGATIHVQGQRGDYFTRIRYEDITGITPNLDQATEEPETDITKIPLEKYAGYPERYEPGKEAEMQVARDREKEWNMAIRAAISEGRVTPEAAIKLGYFPGGDEAGGGKFGDPRHGWVPLPKTLYHVTTDKKSVLSSGLKSRAELGQAHGKGLGGGDDTSISFTDDPKIAHTIAMTMKEARRVATGEYTIDAMLADAEAGRAPGLKMDKRRSWLTRWMRQYNKDWKPGDPLPLDVEAARRGVTIQDNLFGGYSDLSKEMKKTEDVRGARLDAFLRPLAVKLGLDWDLMQKDPGDNKEASKERDRQWEQFRRGLTQEQKDQWNTLASTSGIMAYRFFKEDLPPGWKPVDRDMQRAADGTPLYLHAEKKLDEKEAIEARFNVYKTMLAMREAEGGPENPLFFLSDPEALAKLQPDDIAVLQVEPRPGAMGYRLGGGGGLGEYRTASGRAVQVVAAK